MAPLSAISILVLLGLVLSVHAFHKDSREVVWARARALKAAMVAQKAAAMETAATTPKSATEAAPPRRLDRELQKQRLGQKQRHQVMLQPEAPLEDATKLAAQASLVELPSGPQATPSVNNLVHDEVLGNGVDLEDVSPGTSVKYTRLGKSYSGTVKSVPMVTLDTPQGERIVPLASIQIEDTKHTQRPVASHNSNAKVMQLRQRIVCDVCLQKLKSCDSYIPSTKMLNPVRGPPNRLGRLYTCPASERELYTRDDKFKVLEDKDSPVPGEGERSVCPTKGEASEKRASLQDGQLTIALGICKFALLKKKSALLKKKSFKSCSDLVNNAVPILGRDPVTCAESSIYVFD